MRLDLISYSYSSDPIPSRKCLILEWNDCGIWFGIDEQTQADQSRWRSTHFSYAFLGLYFKSMLLGYKSFRYDGADHRSLNMGPLYLAWCK